MGVIHSKITETLNKTNTKIYCIIIIIIICYINWNKMNIQYICIIFLGIISSF